MTEQLQLREAVGMAQFLGTDAESQLPLHAIIDGVTVVIYPYKPLDLTFRFFKGNDEVSLCFGIHTAATADDLTAYAKRVEESALSGDFPETVSLLLLEHAELLRERSYSVQPQEISRR